VERRFAVLARACRQALIALIIAATPALAGPRAGEAKVQFDRGVAAYTKGDFVTASEALGKSFALKADPETLFAWAQSERRLDHCDKALQLYARLLKFTLPPSNKDAVKTQIAECKDIVAAAAKPEPDPKPEPIEPVRDPNSDPKPVRKIEPIADAPDTTVREQRREETIEGRSWWKDPVGDSLLGLGMVGLVGGAVFILSANSAENDKLHATNYFEYRDLDNKATTRGQIGVISLISGGVLVATSFAWFATHREQDRRGVVISGWIAPDNSGLVISGGF
jgi:hypothetical protein